MSSGLWMFALSAQDGGSPVFKVRYPGVCGVKRSARLLTVSLRKQRTSQLTCQAKEKTIWDEKDHIILGPALRSNPKKPPNAPIGLPGPFQTQSHVGVSVLGGTLLGLVSREARRKALGVPKKTHTHTNQCKEFRRQISTQKLGQIL